MDWSYLNKLKSEFRSLTGQFHDNSTVPVLLSATANDEIAVIPNTQRKLKISVFNLFEVTPGLAKKNIRLQK